MQNSNQKSNDKITDIIFCVIAVYKETFGVCYREILYKRQRYFQKRAEYPAPWKQITPREYHKSIKGAKVIMEDSRPAFGGCYE